MRSDGLNWIRKRKCLAAAVLGGIVAVGVPVGIACVSDGPSSRIAGGDSTVLDLPSPTFASVLQELAGADPHRIADLPRIAFTFDDEFRTDAQDFEEAWRESGGDPMVLAQFDIYREAQEAQERGEIEVARAAALRVLELPFEMRRWRSVEAAFMLARLAGGRHDESIAWYTRVRSHVAEGCHDMSDLACASLGWEARAEFRRCDHARALRLYLAQHLLTRGEDATARESIQIVCGALGALSPEELEPLARDEVAATLVTAWIGACYRGSFEEWYGSYDGNGSPTLESRWLALLESSEVSDVRFSSVLAYATYRQGKFDLAKKWCAIAPADDAGAAWVRAKLLMREGRAEEAIGALRAMIRALPPVPPPGSQPRGEEMYSLDGPRPHAPLLPEPMRRAGVSHHALVMPSGCWEYTETRTEAVLGDLGALLLSRQNYEEAMVAFIDAGYWVDAAYVAERVLTIDELRAFVDREVAEHSYYSVQAATNRRTFRVVGSIASELRHLLARRLGRAGRFEEAVAYMPHEHRGELMRLADAMRLGRDPRRTDAARAKSLWTAARIMREHGLELVGTEVGPDFAASDGRVEGGDPFAIRTEDPDARVTLPSDDELTRVLASAPVDNVRYHYRFVAAGLGWEAAQLMPDDDPETAAVLCQAGSWIKVAAPKRADRFYKALVRRCGDTALGREADRKRWFPVMATAAAVD